MLQRLRKQERSTGNALARRTGWKAERIRDGRHGGRLGPAPDFAQESLMPSMDAVERPDRHDGLTHNRP